MGVKGLWPLLEPVGRRVNIEALTNKRLAVDASIWVHQFVKMMRDAKGEVLRNAHLLGFFRRICKLLFNKIRPVFVFDGATPALKKRTTIARRRQREQQTAKLRKTAEKLLMAQLKKRALDTMQAEQALAAQSKTPRKSKKAELLPAPEPVVPPPAAEEAQVPIDLTQDEAAERDDILAMGQAGAGVSAPARNETAVPLHEDRNGHPGAGPSSKDPPDDFPDEDDFEEQPGAGPSSNRPDDDAGKDGFGEEDEVDENGMTAADRHLQRDIEYAMGGGSMEFDMEQTARDELSNELASWARPRGRQKKDQREPPPPPAPDATKEEEDEDEEEADLAVAIANLHPDELDPTVLSALPASMQLDVMAKLREQMTYINREGFQQRSAQPQSFSSFQMQEYLKTSAFRKQMQDVRDQMNAAAATSVGGGHAVGKRIAGDSGREYILHRDASAPTDGRSLFGSGDLIKPPLAALHSIESSPPVGKAPVLRARLDGLQQSGSPGLAERLGVDMPRATPVKTESLQISFELPGTAGNGEAEDEEEDEWETVGEATMPIGGSQQASGSQPNSVAGVDLAKRPRDWRERMAQRQKFWSMSHGFQFGRKLADWGKGDGKEEAKPGPVAEGGMLGAEEAELQRAIELSLKEASGHAGASSQPAGSDDEDDWADVPFPDSIPSSQLDPGSPSQAGPPQQEAFLDRPSSQPDNSNLAQGFEGNMPPNQLPEERGRATVDANGDASALEVWQEQGEHGQAVELPDMRMQLADAAPRSENAAAALREVIPQSKSPSSPIVSPFKQPPAAQAPSSSDAAAKEPGTAQMEAKEPDDPPRPAKAIKPRKLVLPSAPKPKSGRTQTERRAPAGGQPEVIGTTQKPAESAVGQAGQRSRTDQDEAKRSVASDAAGRKVGGSQPPQSVAPEQVAAAVSNVASGVVDLTAGDGEQPVLDGANIAAAGDEGDPMPEALRSRESKIDDKAGGDDTGGDLQRVLELSVQQMDDTGEGQDRLEAAGAGRQGADVREAMSKSDLPGSSSVPSLDLDSLGDSSRLDSDALAALPSDLAAQLEEHITDSGRLASIPDDLAAQIEEQRKETKRMQKEHRAQAGIADNITGDMFGDCQELLQLFGLPYIIAPMEAEAQCAWLDLNGLVDGVVTDDNDVFLFGGEHVYRHIFEDRKYVEEYRASDFEAELGLTREKLIHLALLLGSDYTEGVPGIGIVNALEVVNAFPDREALKEFKQWVMTPDAELLAAAQHVGRKGSGKAQAGGADGEGAGEDAVLRKFKQEHKSARKNWDIPNDFPNRTVIQAYLEAKVDSNKDKITYGRPDLELLRNFCNIKFGWAFAKTDEIMEPVIKAYDQRETQRTLDGYLTFNQRFAKIKSKRLQKAVSAIRGAKNPAILMEDGEEDEPLKKKAQKRAQTKALTAGPAEESQEALADSTARLAEGTGVLAGLDDEDLDLSQAADELENSLQAAQDTNGPRGSRETRGRGRKAAPKRGRGRGRGAKPAKGAERSAPGGSGRGEGGRGSRGRGVKRKAAASRAASVEDESGDSESESGDNANDRGNQESNGRNLTAAGLGALATQETVPSRELRQRKEGVLYQEGSDQEGEGADEEEGGKPVSDEEEWEALEAGL